MPIDNIYASIEANNQLLLDQLALDTFSQAVKHVIDCYRKGGRIYNASNGGSAADAQRLAAEFVSRLARERNPLPAEALTTENLY